MGGFYGSVQIRTEKRDEVKAVLEELSRQKKKFLLGPALNGWVGVYPDHGGQDFEVGRDLAKHLPYEIIAIVVHDDDILAYEYHRDGERIDQYNSIPDYFGEVSDQEKAELKGRPETFAHLATSPEKFASIVERLMAQAHKPDVFVSGLLEEFAETFGIQNAVTSYEYLKEHEETDDIEGWDKFIHIPDLTDERLLKRKAAAAIKMEKTRLIRDGLLLAERGGAVGWASPWPWCCPAPDGGGFLVALSSHADAREKSVPIERHGRPWTSSPASTSWVIGAHVYGMELSASGRYLAVAHAAGDWKAELWDLKENRLVAVANQIRAVSDVGFMPDESAMFSVSSDGEGGQVIITPIGAGEPKTIPVGHAKFAAVHPSGASLVVSDNLNRLLVLDVASGRVERTHFIGDRTPPVSTMDIDTLEQKLRQEQDALIEGYKKTGLPSGVESIEALRRQFEEGNEKLRQAFARPGMPVGVLTPERGSESVFRIKSDPTGDRLALATNRGVRVYAWHDVLNTSGELLPISSVDVAGDHVEGSPVQRNNSYIYDLDVDPDRDRLVFAGLDGRVRFLDLGTGRSGTLLDPPAHPPISKLSLSRDRQTLALTTNPDMFERSQKKRGPMLQFWDYEAISAVVS